MREIKDTRPSKDSSEYRRPSGRSEAAKVSPLRGKKQRWTNGELMARTRRDVIAKSSSGELPRLVRI